MIITTDVGSSINQIISTGFIPLMGEGSGDYVAE